MKNFFYLIISFIIVVNSGKAQSGEDTISVTAGWNLIGAVSTGATLDILSTEPPGIITAPFYGYSPAGAYYQADSLYRVNGYWVYADQNGLVIFGPAPRVPTLLSPLNGELGSTQPILVWNVSPRATSYTLQVSTDDQFINLVYNQSGLTNTSQQVSGLDDPLTYYWRVRAESYFGTSDWSTPAWSFTTWTPCPGTSTVTYAGKTYNTVQIGTQCWLKENLDIGTNISTHQEQTNNNVIEKYCWADSLEICETYGALYQWDEAMQYVTTEGAQGICPTGWHLPTGAELVALQATVSNDGNSLKAVGQGSGSGAGTNTSGFSALLAGVRYGWNGGSYYLGYYVNFWSSQESGPNYKASIMVLGHDYSNIFLLTDYQDSGLSVRCIKD